jgi:hypothetical protein
VVITFIHNMRQSLILATHNANLGIASRTLPPAKQVVF